MAGGQQARQGPRRAIVGGLELCEETASVTLDGMPVKRRRWNSKFWRCSQNQGMFSADGYTSAYGMKAVNTDPIMVHVRNCAKNRAGYQSPKYLKVVWGIGYKIEAL